jgi:recombination protein RecA
VKVVKNKVAAPFKQTEFDLMYNEGISREGEIIALGEKMGIIKKSGSSYSYFPTNSSETQPSPKAPAGEVKLGRGYDATRQFLKAKENKKIADEILKQIRKKLLENDGSISPVKEEAEETENEE